MSTGPLRSAAGPADRSAPRVLALTHVFPRAADDPSAPFLLTWARALREAGVDLAVVAPHDEGLPSRHRVADVPVLRARYAPEGREQLAYRGEMHHLVRRPSGPPLLAGLVGALAREVRAQVRAGKPDVLHVHWWVPGAIAARMARVDVPVVVTVHGTDVALLEARPRLAAVARWALQGAARVEAVSSALAARLEAATGIRPAAVNPMPLEPSRLDVTPIQRPPRPGGPIAVLGVGRLVPEKGFGDLVEAAARCAVEVRLRIVGDGPQHDELARRAAELGVHLDLPGRVSPDELGALYAGADVVAQPSHAEGLGLVAAEAVLAGVPVVVTDCGGTRELFPPDELVAVADPDGLAAALDAVATDPAAARDRAAAAAERVRALLTPQAATERTLAGYRAVLGP